MIQLAECANLGLLTDDQNFEFGKTIVEAAKDKALLEEFVNVLWNWLRSQYAELIDAYNAHPKMVKCFFFQQVSYYPPPRGTRLTVR